VASEVHSRQLVQAMRLLPSEFGLLLACTHGVEGFRTDARHQSTRHEKQRAELVTLVRGVIEWAMSEGSMTLEHRDGRPITDVVVRG